MNLLDPRIAHLEIDRRLQTAERQRRARWARTANRSMRTRLGRTAGA